MDTEGCALLKLQKARLSVRDEARELPSHKRIQSSPRPALRSMEFDWPTFSMLCAAVGNCRTCSGCEGQSMAISTSLNQSLTNAHPPSMFPKEPVSGCEISFASRLVRYNYCTAWMDWWSLYPTWRWPGSFTISRPYRCWGGPYP